MAAFHVHFSTAAILGAAYGAAGAWYGNYDWGVVFLAGGLTVMGGLTPDLDSDSGRPIRELFGVAGFIFPLFLIPRLRRFGLSLEESLSILVGSYLFIRYGLSEILKRISVHRGMFHSLPALLVSGLAVYNVYHNEHEILRYYMAGGMMLGFLLHLVLDEIYSVDLSGMPRLKQSFGTALKLFSTSWRANLVCYALLAGTGYLAWRDHTTQEPQRTTIRPGMYSEQFKKKW